MKIVFFLLAAAPIFPTHREPLFSNDQVKAWKTYITPDDELKMHRHDQARAVVVLKGGVLQKVEATGETSQLVLETGKAYWLEADPAGTMHADINISGETIEVIVMEVK